MRNVLLLLFVLLPVKLFALDVYAAPLMYIDETDRSNRNVNSLQADLLNALWSVETGMALQFRAVRDNRINPPQSLTDAAAVCRSERIEYLLYGFLTRNQHSFQMEIRFYDYINRRVSQTFFSMDSIDNYSRLIQDMALKILLYIGETFNLEIIPEKTGFTRMSIPAYLGYWTPMDRDWIEIMLGTFVLGSGWEIIPNDNLFVYKGKTCYLSTGAELKYRLGVGNPSRYEAYNHTIYMTFPLRLNVILESQHEVFAGLGLVYFFEYFLVTLKYERKQSFLFSNMGLNVNLGYRFIFNETYSFFFRNDFDVLINEHPLLTYSPVIGMNIQIYNKEVVRKW